MMRCRISRLVAAGVASAAMVVGTIGVPGTAGAVARSAAAPVMLDLGPLGRAAALKSCATDAFVDGRPGRLRVSYGMRQRTPFASRGSFVLRNHAGRTLFCDMFGRQRPSVRPFPTTNSSRPAVHYTNPIREWRCKTVLFRTNAWLRVQDPVQSARMRYWVDGVAGPWFVTRRQGRFVHLQSWLFDADVPDGAALKIQTQVLNGAGRVLDVSGIPSEPRTLRKSCGVIIG